MAAAQTDKFEGIPEAKLKEYMERGLSRFTVRTGRRDNHGRLNSLPSLRLESIQELAELDQVLAVRYGGGRFTCSVFNSEDTVNRLFVTDISVEGPPVPTSLAGAQSGARVVVPGQAPPLADPLESAISRNAVGPVTGDSYIHAGYSQRVATHTSDEIAVKTIEEVRAEKRALEDKLNLLQAQVEQNRLDQDRRDREAERLRHEREREAEKLRHDMELKRLEDRIAAMADRPKTPGLMEMLPALAPFVPVFSAMVSANKDKASDAIASQQRMFETMLAATKQPEKKDNSKDMMEMIKTIAPIATPLLSALINASGPKAQAELLSAQAEQQAMVIQMMSQLIENASAGNEDSPWLKLAETLMQGASQVVETMQKQAKQPNAVQQIGQVAQRVISEATQPSAAQTTAVTQRTQGEGVADMILAHPQVPDELKTAEWRVIFVGLHDKEPAEDVAKALANHIFNLDESKQLPSFLEPLFTSEDPEKVLEGLVKALPIWQLDMAYAKRVIAKAVEILSTPEDGTPGDADGDEAIVTSNPDAASKLPSPEQPPSVKTPSAA